MLCEIELAHPPAVEAVEAVEAGRRRRAGPGVRPYLYLVPALVSLVVWVYRPLLDTVRYSFERWNLLPTSSPVGVGLANYRHLFALPELWSAVRVTLLFIAVMLVVGVVVPVGVGVLTQQIGGRARAVYRGILFLPVLVSPIVAATVWSFLLAPHGGVIDTVLGWFGFGAPNWLEQPGTARLSILAISGWKILGFSILIVAAGLAAINPDCYEAAEIDGASRWQCFRSLTIPLLSPTLVFLVITTVLLSSQTIFPLINALTQGGPSGATTDIYYFLYNYGFTSFDVGTESAAAVLFFIAFGVAALGCVKLLDRFSFYDD